MARIFVLEGSIGTIVRVGGWLPDKEESMWAGILYDLACLVADSIQPKRPKTARKRLLKSLHYYLKNPSADYRGKYSG
ncbi:MAG: hypothetical protein CMO55_06655 [Verrucomicrobiales bacterium]|nr:hypothetical protein [Verrucomicrobiales bacterium]